MKLQDLPDVHEIGKQIGTPVEDWKGRCHEIAGGLIDMKLVTGRLIYGHYLGPVSEHSMFANKLELPFIQHGWIIHESGMVVDPTRWVFEHEEPYIFIDLFGENNDQYDEGGNVWRATQTRPPPDFRKSDQVVETDTLDPAVRWFIMSLLSYPPKVTSKHVFWLANLPPDTLGSLVSDIYQWIIDRDFPGFIPIDNRIKYVGQP